MQTKIVHIFSNNVNVEYILNAVLVSIVEIIATIINAMHTMFKMFLDL